jgi:hypothetical protein
MELELQPIDHAMSTLEYALEAGLTLKEVVELGNFAQSLEDWDYAVILCTEQEETT